MSNFAQDNANSKHLLKEKNCSNCKNVKSVIWELKLITKIRGIKGYKSMSKDKLLTILNAPEPITNT